MRNHYDHLSKHIGREALGRSGATFVHDEISPETQHADLRHEPDPARRAERKRLGLLGRLAAVPCLIEVYSHAPTAEELRACLTKHLASWRQRARKARAENRRRRKQRRLPRRSVAPFLWIIAAGAPSALLTKLALEPAPGWPKGVYSFGADVLRVGIVVASELPRDRSTLLVRLMAAGPLLVPAVEELGRLRPRSHERSVATRSLVKLQHVLRKKPTRTPEERKFIMTMYDGWEDARTEMGADAVLTVLRARGIAVPATARKRILGEKDVKQLKRWIAKASVATSIEDVIGKRS